MQETLSQNFLQNLYLSKQVECSQPILQILSFQGSENNPKQIIIRLSDGITFFDATLIGPYQFAFNKIIVSPFTAYHGTMEFHKFDIVKIVDFFSKIDVTKICRLKMMIRKIVQIKQQDHKIGRPQDLAFYMEVNQLVSDSDIPMIQSPNEKNERTNGRLQEDQVKLCEQDQNLLSKQNIHKTNDKKAIVNKELQMLGICKDRNPDEPLTCRQIMNGYDGFFIGRLVRLKQTIKDGKQSSIPMLALGFLDSSGEILRLNLLGKMAIREQKQLKKGKCYYLKGLQVVQTKGASYIKLRQKDYKLHGLNEQQITCKYGEQYYHWQHEYDYIQNENVDVVGVIQDIEQKTFYGIKSVGDVKQPKQVIRVVIRNRYKLVKVSFWSDQLKNLLKFNLKKGEIIIIQDVKKKKLVFLDYSIQSVLIRVEINSELYNKINNFLPQQIEYEKPINIKNLYDIRQIDKFNSRVHTIYAYITKICDEKMLFKYCDLCKKKINIKSQKCFDCKGNVISIKYNTNIQFSDYSGSLIVAVFDSIAQKLFGISAFGLKDMRQNQQEYNKFIECLLYEAFLIGVEIKHDRFILRNIQGLKPIDLKNWYQQSIKITSKLMYQNINK